jgi:hypothetical protein
VGLGDDAFCLWLELVKFRLEDKFEFKFVSLAVGEADEYEDINGEFDELLLLKVCEFCCMYLSISGIFINKTG